MPIRDHSVGLIIALDAFAHADNDLNPVREIYQILKKGRTLIRTALAFTFLKEELAG